MRPRLFSLRIAIALAMLPLATLAAAERQPQRWAILIGVNNYANLDDLQFPSQDVEALSQRLVESGFPEKQVFVLRDEAKESKYLPFKANLEKQLDLVLNLVGKDDLVLVAFSGHGMHLDGGSYLCPTEADVERPKDTMLAVEEVYARMGKSPAAMKLIVLDACRNDPRPAGKKSATPKEDAQKLAASFERPPDGIWLLASCGPGQVSYEDQDLKHGVFMSYLLEGLAGKADGNKNGKVSLGELYEFASQETKIHVARKWSDYQVPAQKGELNGVFEFVPSGPVAGEVITNTIGMKLVAIPAGQFEMGTSETNAELLARFPDAKAEYFDDERPVHTVRITKPFYLGQFEVTQAEYAAVMGKNPSAFASTGLYSEDVAGLDTSRFPVEYVSWDDAQAFCRTLSAKEGKTYRLPTEAEWEYACRAGTKTLYYSGDTVAALTEAGWYGAYSDPVGNSPKRTNLVGQKKPNAFGLFDMHGNVWEWCGDWYDEMQYEQFAGRLAVDPQGAHDGPGRVLRGGGWYDEPHESRVASRRRGAPTVRVLVTSGFRVVCVP